MEPNKKELAAERRAKLAKLRQAQSLQDRDITSAPSLTKVDEFHEEFGAADKRDAGVEVDVGHGVVDKHKICKTQAKGSSVRKLWQNESTSPTLA